MSESPPLRELYEVLDITVAGLKRSCDAHLFTCGAGMEAKEQPAGADDDDDDDDDHHSQMPVIVDDESLRKRLGEEPIGAEDLTAPLRPFRA